jgi:peptide/nickel transport system substrate-binding protein
MTRTDSLVVGTLVVLLAVIAGIVTVPSMLPAAEPVARVSPSPTAQPAEPRPYREGVLGHPVSVSPFSARTQADRDLVSLVFAGLVRNGPDGSLVPDLADRWSVDEKGAVWTFHLRDGATWHDGQRVTADDVVFTIHTLQDPDYSGPGARSWEGIEVETDGLHSVTFTLATPLGGFLQATTQPIAPAHLLAGVPVAQLADEPFGRMPIGAGPFAVAALDDDMAELVPAFQAATDATDEPGPSPTADPAMPSFGVAPSTRPTRPTPYLTGMEFRFFDDPGALADAYRAGELDAASGLSSKMTRELGQASDSRVIHYPGATLTTVLPNLRPGHPEFADTDVRRALLQAIDRTALIDDAFAGAAEPAAGLIPPSSWLFDTSLGPPVAYDRAAAIAALKKAGWTRSSDGWHIPNVKDPVKIELVSTDGDSNPATYRAAEAVAQDWSDIGLSVTHVSLPPNKFVKDRLATGDFSAAVADMTIGLDPDLYPLLASSQTLSGGSNVLGLQDPKLDDLLAAARKPGSDAVRTAAYAAIQKAVREGQYVLPLAFGDEAIVVRDTVEGPSMRQVADPADRFWDVLTWRLAAGR